MHIFVDSNMAFVAIFARNPTQSPTILMCRSKRLTEAHRLSALRGHGGRAGIASPQEPTRQHQPKEDLP